MSMMEAKRRKKEAMRQSICMTKSPEIEWSEFLNSG